MSEPAGTCHDCGRKGEPAERWINSDTCDACAYRAASRKWGTRGAPLPPHGAGPNYPSSRCRCGGCRSGVAARVAQ